MIDTRRDILIRNLIAWGIVMVGFWLCFWLAQPVHIIYDPNAVQEKWDPF
jgi:hypothetical protein